MAVQRTTLFTKDAHIAALSLSLSETGGVITLGAGTVEGLARTLAARRPQPVMKECHGERLEALQSFMEHTATSLRNGWQIIYHGEPNIG
jgi:hypothetical protein